MGFEKFASSSTRDFNLVEELFRGSTGSVWKAVFKYDKKVYVLKQNKLDGSRTRKHAMNEVELLLQLSHENCIKCHGHFFDESHNSVYIVLDYCEGGDLSRLIDERRKESQYFEESEIWNYFLQICKGVQHLHQMGIVHRDLKTMNILLSRDRTNVKVADLGVSRQMSEDTMLLETFYGTPLYLSPEMVDGTHYTEKTDIWSLGVILFELAALHPPFRSSTLMGLARAIKVGSIGDIPDRYHAKDGSGSSLERCIKWMLNQDFSKRPSINQVIKRVQHHAADAVIAPNPAPAPKEPPPSNRPPAPQRDAKEDMKPSADDSRAQAKGTASPPPPAAPRKTEPARPSHSEESASSKKSRLCNGVEVAVVAVDPNRLVAVERREKQLLKKLLQTRGISSSITRDFVSQEEEAPRGKSAGSRSHQEVAAGALNEKAASLEERIRLSQSKLAVIEAAMRDNGEMTETDAKWCGLEAALAKVSVDQSSEAKRPVVGRSHDPPSRGSIGGSHLQGRDKHEGFPGGAAVHQLQYDNPFAGGPGNAMFQQQHAKHTVFAPRDHQSRPAHRPQSRQTPDPPPAASEPHRPGTAPRQPPSSSSHAQVREDRDDGFEWLRCMDNSRNRRGQSAGHHRHRPQTSDTHARNSKSGRYNVITGAWEAF